MSTFTVTGSAGFIGTHLVKALQAEGHKVIALDIAEEQEGDAGLRALMDVAAVASDGIFHLAACADWRRLEHDTLAFTENIRVADNVFRAAWQFNTPVIFASTMMVYEQPGIRDRIHEDVARTPQTRYAISKAAGEDLAWHWDPERKRTAVARFWNVYGPGQEHAVTYKGAMVPNLIKKLAQYRENGPYPERTLPLRCFGKPDLARDFVYVEDVVSALLKIMGVALLSGAKDCPRIYNVGSGTPTQHIDVLGMIAEHVKVKLPDLEYDEKIDPSDPARFGPIYASIDRLRSIGWEPGWTMHSGIAATVAGMEPIQIEGQAFRSVPS